MYLARKFLLVAKNTRESPHRKVEIAELFKSGAKILFKNAYKINDRDTKTRKIVI